MCVVFENKFIARRDQHFNELIYFVLLLNIFM